MARLLYGKGWKVKYWLKGCSQGALEWDTVFPRSHFEYWAISPPRCPRSSSILPTCKTPSLVDTEDIFNIKLLCYGQSIRQQVLPMAKKDQFWPGGFSSPSHTPPSPLPQHYTPLPWLFRVLPIIFTYYWSCKSLWFCCRYHDLSARWQSWRRGAAEDHVTLPNRSDPAFPPTPSTPDAVPHGLWCLGESPAFPKPALISVSYLLLSQCPLRRRR